MGKMIFQRRTQNEKKKNKIIIISEKKTTRYLIRFKLHALGENYLVRTHRRTAPARCRIFRLMKNKKWGENPFGEQLQSAKWTTTNGKMTEPRHRHGQPIERRKEMLLCCHLAGAAVVVVAGAKSRRELQIKW